VVASVQECHAHVAVTPGWTTRELGHWQHIRMRDVIGNGEGTGEPGKRQEKLGVSSCHGSFHLVSVFGHMNNSFAHLHHHHHPQRVG
jgi:hypothetical protein